MTVRAGSSLRVVGPLKIASSLLSLLVAVVAPAEPPQPPPAASSRPAQATPISQPPAPPQVSPQHLELAGGLGFSSLYYLLNREAWPGLVRDGHSLRSGPAAVGLADPLQAVVLYNAWHVPAAHGADDIRLADLKKRVLQDTLVFTAQWPAYVVPGYIALVQKRDREWALVANLGGHFLVEDRSGIGVCASPSP